MLSEVDRTLKSYAPLVRKMAHMMIGKLPASIEMDDLIQVGMIGLCEAVERYDGRENVKFESFATRRVQGAMLDYLRSNDYMGRQDRRLVKSREKALEELRHQLGRNPHDSELAEKLNVSLAELHSIERIGSVQVVHVDDLNEDDFDWLESLVTSDETPMTTMLEHEKRALLVQEIERLPEREQQVMAMIYDEEMTTVEIGAVLGLSAHKVGQLHKDAIHMLKRRISWEL